MRSSRSDALLLVLGAALLATTAWTLVRGQQNRTLQADEFAFVLAGAEAFVGDFLGTLLDPSPVNRGPERLMALLVSVPYALFDDTATMFRAAHALTALAWILAALPAYGLARLLRLGRRQALMVAVLTLVTPWLIYGTTLLNVTAAFPLTTALVWATVRAVTRPSVGNDLLVLAIAAAGAAARTGNLPFVAVVAVAVVVQVWRDRPPGESAVRLPVRLVRTHPVLVGAGVLTLSFVAAVGATDIVGGQYKDAVPDGFGAAEIVARAGLWGSILALGSGLVVVMVGLAWAVRQAARPSDRAAGAFAVTALTLFVVFVVSTLEAPPEERYVAVLAALAPVSFGAALFRREASALGTLLAGLVVLRAVTENVPAPDEGPYAWMVAPARQFWHRAVENRLTSFGVPESWEVVTLVAVLAIAVAVALCARRRAGAVAGMLLMVLGAAAAQYNTGKWLDGEGWRALAWEERAFVDAAVGGDSAAYAWDYNPRSAELVPFALNRVQMYNRSLAGAIRLEGTPQTWSCCDRDIPFSVDARTGQVRATQPLPRHVIAPPGFQRVGFAARFLGTSRAVAGFGLFDLGAEPRVSFTVDGADGDGWVRPGRAALVRGFTSADGRGPAACARIDLAAPAEAAARFRVGPRRGALAAGAGEQVRVAIPAGGLLRLEGRGATRLPDGRVRALRIDRVTLDCAA